MRSDSPRPFMQAGWSAYDALYAYRQVLTHLYCWGLPEWDQYDEETKANVRRMVANKDWAFDCFEEGKRACIFAGVKMRDNWLAIPFPTAINEGTPLPEASRREIVRILDETYAELCRLDVAEVVAENSISKDAPLGREPKRPAYSRDHTFREWYYDERQDTFHSNATIRDKWNLEHPREKVTIQVVIKGIAKADKEAANGKKKT